MSRQRPAGMSGSFEKSVKGGTKIKLAPPKAKYVEHILVATHAGEAGVAEIFRTLQNRLRDSTWTIVFKALIIVHLMIREGEPNVTLKYVADSPSKLAISNFSDGTSKEYSMASARGPTESGSTHLRRTRGLSSLIGLIQRAVLIARGELVQVQGTNIRHYYTYLLARAKAYKDTRIDWVREGVGRLKRQTVDKGLLRETEAVQSQITKLLQCDLLSTEAENEITVCAFRLLTMDLLVLYGVMNEGTINVLEHYFEMSKYDAQRALGIYKTFTKQTNSVVEFLSTARQYENATRLEIPKLKHAPTSLTSSLEEYLNDPDFEINRRQYLAQQDAKKGKKNTSNGTAESSNHFTKNAVNKGGSSKDFPESKPTQAVAPKSEPKGPAPDLIDFFDSIEQNQQQMAAPPPQQQVPNFGVGPHFQQQQQLQQTGVLPQQTNLFTQNGQQQQIQNGGNFGNGNPFGQPQVQQPVQQNFTEAGFGGYTQQPFGQQQDTFSSPSHNSTAQFPQTQQGFNAGQQPFATSQQTMNTGQQLMNTGQSSNPFRQSMMPQATGPSLASYTNTPPLPASPQSYQSTNPFARQNTGHIPNSPFSSQPTGQGTPFTSPPPPQPQQTAAPPLTPHRTGTNPFARSTPTTQSTSPFTSASPLVATPTGSTNPFRQSTFVNQQTGQGWQAGQGTMGGFEQLDTVPIFPRPGQLPQQQQGAWP